MTRDLSISETTVVATYASRQDAEIAKTQLADHDILALITADDVHPPLQMTEGVKLRVLDHKAEQALNILDVDAKPVPADSGMEMPDAEMHSDDEADLAFSRNGFVQATAWTYVAAFLLMVAVIVAGLWVSSFA